MATTFNGRIVALVPTALGLILFSWANVRDVQERRAERDFQAFVFRLKQGQYEDARRAAERAAALSPGNAYYLAGRCLALARMGGRMFDPSAFLGGGAEPDGEGLSQLGAARDCYQKAVELNPLDHAHHHNLGWLYQLLGQRGPALDSLRRAVALDSSIGLYHLSLGLLYEQGGDAPAAYAEYALAVVLSPEILDSRFFQDLRARAGPEAEGLVSQSISRLEELRGRNPSPIVKARLGKLYLHEGSLERAESLLRQAAAELPSLSRPWYNLGLIAERRGDEAGAQAFYRKASFLDSADPLPWLKLGELNDRRGDTQEATRCYTQAVGKWLNRMSEHAGRASRVYHTRFVIPDDIVPNGFLTYCGPAVEISAVCQRLAKLYGEAGNEGLSSYYAELGAALQRLFSSAEVY